MSKLFKPAKPTVALEGAARPSKIRRDPARTPALGEADEKAFWETREWEIRLAIIGVVAFSVAIAIVLIGFSAITGGEREEPKPWVVKLGDG